MTALSLLRLVPSPPGRIVSGSIKIDGRDLVTLDEAEMRDIRGNEISMIFQEPMTSLNPVMTIGAQISETIRLHEDLSKAAAMQKAIEMLRLVKIPEPKQRAKEYPHPAVGRHAPARDDRDALACNPRVLIADEPTTALDVTIQAQILDLILDLQKKLGTAVVLITHRPRGGRRDGAARHRDVRRQEGRGGWPMSRSCSRHRCTPTRPGCWPRSRISKSLPATAPRRRMAGSRRSPAWCRP